MSNKLVLGLIIIIIIIGLGVIINNSSSNKKNIMEEFIVFKKVGGGGNAAPGVDLTENITLYSSGRFVNKGAEKQLGKAVADQVIKMITDSNVMNKPCFAPPITDYGASFTLSADGIKVTEVVFPGCKEKIQPIENVITSAAKKI